MKSKVLIIDDDLMCLESYQRILSKLDRELFCFANPDSAIEAFGKNPFEFSLAFVDYQYRVDGEQKRLGVSIARKLKALNPMLTVCIVSGDESPESLRLWLAASIDNYLYKPLRKHETIAFAEHHVLNYERDYAPISQNNKKTNDSAILKNLKLIGESKSIVECAKVALRFSKSDLNVLLLGETGTGKELFAHGIHQNSEAKSQGIYPVNCSNYRENSQLLEVELFGSEKGAFTGAERKAGILEIANGGTVFLDEIHHLSDAAQSKLLRVLQEKKIRRVGGQKEYSVKFRLIAAGKTELIEMCETGKFSPDLFFRLKGLDLEIPPLRERKSDIRPLVASFFESIEERTGSDKQISARTLEFLEKYDWPGNVRELLQLIEKLHVLVDGPIITPKHLPDNIRSGSNLGGDIQTLTELDKEYKKTQITLILNTLNEANHNFTEATKRLGLGDKRSTLRSRMKQLNIKDLSQKEKSGLLNQLASNFL